MALEGTIVMEVDSLFLSAKISGFSISTWNLCSCAEHLSKV